MDRKKDRKKKKGFKQTKTTKNNMELRSKYINY
jgi:hypothetical protein